MDGADGPPPAAVVLNKDVLVITELSFLSLVLLILVLMLVLGIRMFAESKEECKAERENDSLEECEQ